MVGAGALDLSGEDGGAGLVQPGKGTAFRAPNSSSQHLQGSSRRESRVLHSGVWWVDKSTLK